MLRQRFLQTSNEKKYCLSHYIESYSPNARPFTLCIFKSLYALQQVLSLDILPCLHFALIGFCLALTEASNLGQISRHDLVDQTRSTPFKVKAFREKVDIIITLVQTFMI